MPCPTAVRGFRAPPSRTRHDPASCSSCTPSSPIPHTAASCGTPLCKRPSLHLTAIGLNWAQAKASREQQGEHRKTWPPDRWFTPHQLRSHLPLQKTGEVQTPSPPLAPLPPAFHTPAARPHSRQTQGTLQRVSQSQPVTGRVRPFKVAGCWEFQEPTNPRRAAPSGGTRVPHSYTTAA